MLVHEHRLTRIGLAIAVVVASAHLHVANAQQQAPPSPSDWQTTTPAEKAPQPLSGGSPQAAPPAAQPAAPTGMTVVPRTGAEQKAAPAAQASLTLEALLTADGQRIDTGIVWRVFKDKSAGDAKGARLVETRREATPSVKLAPGDYVVNAAYGRANLTRRISLKPGDSAKERFVLNAGGLSLKALVGTAEAPPSSIAYSVLAEDRDQFGNRLAVITGARPGLIIRLNAGIYQIVSTYGDANAIVRADVTVEAGKLTEATIQHTAARVTLKLVDRAGGEAIAGTQWAIQTAQGEVVKESVGALPSHTLAPGNYVAVARSAGKAYRRDFAVRDGETVQVEVLVE
jgi:hypothetical protein